MMTGRLDFMQCLRDIRSAVDRAGRLRAPGGDIIDRLLRDLESNIPQDAHDALLPLLEASPLSDVARLLEALLFNAENRRDEAEASLAALISSGESSYDSLCFAGDLYLDWRQPAAAQRAYDQAIALMPQSGQAYLRRGRARSAAGDVTAALADLERAALLQPDHAETHLALGDEYRDASMMDAAVNAYGRALALDPMCTAAQNAVDTVIGSQIPAWHAAMLNDEIRNSAFDQAIGRAVGPESLILDIGTGTGLLAMMAARAGAGHVIACEGVGPLAETARDIVARNGFADRITVLHKRSTDLEPGRDLPEPADVIIAEIVDAGLLNENILETLADARARLLKPGATIIPRRAAVFATPIECDIIACERIVHKAAGFDITPFNELTPRLYLQTHLNRYDWRPLAAPAEIFRFDFLSDGPGKGESSVRMTPMADGTAHAIALWFRLELDSETAIATGPTDPPTHWGQAVYALNPPRDLKLNEPVRLKARHDGKRIVVTLAA